MTDGKGDGPVPGPRRMPVTIHDVARHAGISSMTVSRAMNGHKYVSDAMREKVERAIAELNYTPNLTARSLSASVRIGVLYSNPNSSNLGQFLMGALRQSGTSGCQLLIEPAYASADETQGVRKLVEAGVDGMILPPPLCDAPAVIALLRDADVLALAFATAMPREGVSSVSVDDFEGAQVMTAHLIGLGHRDIAFIRGDPGHSPSARREEGFRAAFATAGLPVPEARIVDGLFTYRSGMEAAQRLLGAAPRPTAIFASNDEMAAAVIAVAHGLGVALPRDLSIAGFDDAYLASTIWPELTTIRQPIAEMSATAVRMICEQVREARAGQAVAARHELAPLALIERASTGAPNA